MPPSSTGKSFSFGSPSSIGITVDSVIDVNAGREGYDGIVAAYTYHAPLGMIREQVAAAVLAPLPVARSFALYSPIRSSPAVTSTCSGAQSVKALTGPADQLRHDSQWQ